VLRRTSTIDVARPEGMGGPRRIDARARDAVGRDGGWAVLGDAGLEGVVDPDGVLLTVQVSGSDGSEAALVGAVVGPGFRGRAAQAFPHDRAHGTLRWTLLDDLPPTMLVSNYARLRAGYQPPWIAEGGHPPKVDICSGWQAKGAMIGMAEREGRQPVTLGPSAPRLDVAGEPDAWHAVEPLPSTGSRRRRRLDVAIDNDDHLLVVDAMFRDTYAQGPDDEIIVHEYGVRARVHRGSLTVVDAVADPHRGHAVYSVATPTPASTPPALSAASRLARTSATTSSIVSICSEAMRTVSSYSAMPAVATSTTIGRMTRAMAGRATAAPSPSRNDSG
jgi:hypothetical protein